MLTNINIYFLMAPRILAYTLTPLVSRDSLNHPVYYISYRNELVQ